MLAPCTHPMCRQLVPAVLQGDRLCPLHFLRRIDERCKQMHREMLAERPDGRRQAEINECLAAQALALAQFATSGTRLPDDVRPCILNAFLTLINLCERVARLAGQERGTGVRPPAHHPLNVAPLPAVGAKP